MDQNPGEGPVDAIASSGTAIPSSPDFGEIMQLATGTAPRIMQLAVKYLF